MYLYHSIAYHSIVYVCMYIRRRTPTAPTEVYVRNRTLAVCQTEDARYSWVWIPQANSGRPRRSARIPCEARDRPHHERETRQRRTLNSLDESRVLDTLPIVSLEALCQNFKIVTRSLHVSACVSRRRKSSSQPRAPCKVRVSNIRL